MQESHAPIFNIVLCYTAHGMSCATIHNGYEHLLSIKLSEEKVVLWDKCGDHLEAKQHRQDSKNRSKKDAITDILDALSIA